MNKTEESYFNFNYTYSPQYIICLFGVISHILLFAAFIKDPLKCFRTSGVYLVANLAVSDVIMCFLGPATISVVNVQLNQFILKIFKSIHCVSVITMFSISLDRYIMVSEPIRHRVLMGGKFMAGWIALTWLSGAVFFLKFFIFGITGQDELIEKCLFCLIIVFAVGLYIGTYFALKKQSKNIALQNSTSTIASRNEELRILKEQRFLTTIILIASITFVSLVLSVLVHQVILLIGLPNNTFYNVLARIIGSIYFLNFAINPLIYFMRLPNYRKTFSYLVRKQ